MTDMPFSQPFGARTALSPGALSFAGRRRLRNLVGTLGGTTTNSVSVVGPRQSGRSSLLQQLSYTEHMPERLKDAVVVQASFRAYRGKPQGAIGYLIGEISNALQRRDLPFQAVQEASSMVDAVNCALAICPGRLIIVIDDFEAVGSDLQKDHQSDLRQAVYHQTRAGYVVASRLPLAKCLQEWGDDLSDLAPILSPMPDLLEPLSARELQEMIQKAVPLDPASPLAQEAAKFVHERVGGFALWAQQALAVLAEDGVLQQPGSTLPQEQFEEIERRIRHRLRGDWNLSYRRLSASAKRALEQPEETVERSTLEELFFAGWVSGDSKQKLKPTGRLLAQWIQERGWEEDTPTSIRRDEEDHYDRLVATVDRLNTKYQRMTGKRRERLIRVDVFSSSQDMPFLRRTVTRSEDFGRFVLSLSRLLYDGTGGATGGKLNLPEACYQHPDCIVRQLMTLRNAWVHLSHPDEQIGERNLESEVAVYKRYLGVADPQTPEQFGQLSAALMNETIRFINELAHVCPFGPELKVEHLFQEQVGVAIQQS